MRPHCSIPDCEAPTAVRSWCKKHYLRWLRHGDPIITLNPGRGLSWTERFWPKVDRSEQTRCWPWLAAKTGWGYGSFDIKGRDYKAHRIAYELLIGPIPEGLTLDHLCRNRACVNPAHLEAVSMRTNLLRGVGPPAQNAAKTHCPAGHPYDLFNTRSYHGKRHCRTCSR